MKTKDILKLSTRIFKTNRMRTILTVLGIGIGIGAILFLVSLGYGLQKVILEKIASSDALLAVDVVSGTSEELKLNQSLIDTISKLDSVEEISPLVGLNSLMDIDGFSGGITAEFVNDSYFRLSGLELEQGEIFKDDKQIVVSTAALMLFNLDAENIKEIKDIKLTVIKTKEPAEGEEVVEGEIELKEIENTFTISGVIKEDNVAAIFLSLNNIRDFQIDEYNQLKVKAKDRKNVDILKEEVYDMGYGVSSISETIDQANKIFTIIQIILGTFGVIALIVSAIGMFNTMTIALLQRTKEIGIMKAIGAKNRDIKKMFLTEAVLIGFLGGAAGLGIGFMIQYIFNLFLNILAKTLGGSVLDVFYTPLWFIVLIIIFSTFVGLLTGVYPALRASKLNPLDALRYK